MLYPSAFAPLPKFASAALRRAPVPGAEAEAEAQQQLSSWASAAFLFLAIPCVESMVLVVMLLPLAGAKGLLLLAGTAAGLAGLYPALLGAEEEAVRGLLLVGLLLGVQSVARHQGLLPDPCQHFQSARKLRPIAASQIASHCRLKCDRASCLCF